MQCQRKKLKLCKQNTYVTKTTATVYGLQGSAR